MASPPLMGSPDVPTMTQGSSSRQGVRKSGYLRKQKHGHKRFFVLQGPGATPAEPARLEYYESEKKWHSKPAKRSIALDATCLNVNKRVDAKHKYLIALYTRDEYLAVAADSEAEQESWYQALSELLSESRAGGCRNTGSCPQPGTQSPCNCAAEDPEYGVITPASLVYKEVWQVTLKPKGIGQARNMVGLHRLCLSARTVAFMRPNAEAPVITLQLMNIRRCGHSDSFFFVELGRSSLTGPGEIWMQADDAVVAQNIHETILEAMRALKELTELRPRSKSQSNQSNPISVPTPRRSQHGNLPPSQTGLPGPTRRARTDSSGSSTAATTPPTRLGSAPCTRIRTASEGDRALTLSPGALRTHLSRSNTLAGPRPHFHHQPRLPPPGALQHSRSMSMPVSRSPPSATSPVSLSSSSSGHGSDNSGTQRPSSCSASVSCSPSDAGFMSLDEYSSSPGDVIRLCPPGVHVPRSNTPDSIPETPPTPGHQMNGYMFMERPPSSSSLCLRHCHRCISHEAAAAPGYRKRTYSLTTPARQRIAPQQVSSTSLDEGTLLRRACRGSSGRLPYIASPKLAFHPYPEDYGDVEIGGSQHSSSSNLAGDDGYMPMVPGAALVGSSLSTPTGAMEDYMPMSPASVSSPQQILCPRMCSPQLNGFKTGESSPEDSGYMRMMCGSRLSADSSDGKLSNGGDYLNMSPGSQGKLSNGGDYLNMSPGSQASVTPPDFFFHPHFNKEPSVAKPGPLPAGSAESEPYVLMHSPGCTLMGEGPAGTLPAHHPPAGPSPVRQSRTSAESFFHRCRAVRPSRLALGSLRTLPSMNEHPLPPEPKSPGGEYINIDFGDQSRGRYSPQLGAEPHASPDYMNLDYGSYRSPHSRPQSRESKAASPQPGRAPQGCGRYMLEDGDLSREPSPSAITQQQEDEDYTEMTFSTAPAAPTPPQPIYQKTEGAPQLVSPTSGVQRLTLLDATAFPLPPLDPDRGAKVIRADAQGGRRRHSSETFSSTTTVTPVSPSFAHNPKRHSSASVENVSVPRRGGGESSPEAPTLTAEHGGGSSPMCRETSAGFQNGLDHIHISADWTQPGGSGTPGGGGKLRPLLAVGDAGAYASMDFFLVHTLREAAANGKRGKELILSHDLAAQSTT